MPQSIRTTIVPTAGGLTIRKTGTGTEAVRHLHTEARMLLLAAGPGVPELLAVEDIDHADGMAGAALLMAHAGQDIRRGVPGDDVDRVRFAAALAEVVARLHAVGIVHGALTPGHILLGGDGTPWLCGFGRARLSTDAPAPAAAEDVAAIGRLVHHLLGADIVVTPMPTTRFSRTRAPRRSIVDAARTVADQAEADDPAARPGAAAMAVSLRNLVDEVGATTNPSRDTRRLAAVSVGLVGLLLAAMGAAQLATAAGADGNSVDVAAPGTTPAAPEDCARMQTPRTPPVPADRCTRAAPLPPGGLVLDGVRYAVGTEDDDLLVVDPGCLGRMVVLLIRPDGDVFAFARRPDGSAPTFGLPVTRARPGSRLETGADPCHEALVRTPEGDRTALSLDVLTRQEPA